MKEDAEDLAAGLRDEPRSFGASLLQRFRRAFCDAGIYRRQRRLQLCETLSLGENRILALVECEGRRFLLAATPQSITLLQTMSAPGAPSNEECSRRES